MTTITHTIACACGGKLSARVHVHDDATSGALVAFVARLIAYARRRAFDGDTVRCVTCYGPRADVFGETWPRHPGARR